jgi:hypothetical protein
VVAGVRILLIFSPAPENIFVIWAASENLFYPAERKVEKHIYFRNYRGNINVDGFLMGLL